MHGIYLLRDFCVKGTELLITFGLWKVRVTKESKSKEEAEKKENKFKWTPHKFCNSHEALEKKV